ncbi:uncharacterized protein LOC143616946 [Bidens hawaiensis]|uniref:uncharacterized protein LOC143616946 n=1 Tax=Bidens hawaiensis TaxID=980011 RepID=UPI00404ABB19
MQEHNPIMLHENESSGVGADLGLLEDTLCAETNDSTVVSSMIAGNTENPIDDIIIIKDVEEMSENTVDVTMTGDFKPELFTENKMTEKSESDPGLIESPLLSSDVTRHPTHMTPIQKATPLTEEVEDRMFEVFTENNEKSDADLGLVQNQVTANPGHVTPLKNASVVVSDDKENNVVEVKNIKKDENDKINANGMSIRQLKKLLKAMTLNSHNSKEESDDLGTKRTALQAVCENQMVVGGENEN